MKNLNSEDFRELMAAITVLLGFAYIFSITFITISADNQRFADIVLGMIGTVIFGRVFEYYFGKDDKKKKKEEENLDDEYMG
jgi:phosphotransferase system  glucose/maltose/N-acetylglucosamine-specific IIC component